MDELGEILVAKAKASEEILSEDGDLTEYEVVAGNRAEPALSADRSEGGGEVANRRPAKKLVRKMTAASTVHANATEIELGAKDAGLFNGNNDVGTIKAAGKKKPNKAATAAMKEGTRRSVRTRSDAN